MVPPGGIEPTTSALPRMRSTTELRRRNLRKRPYSQPGARGKALISVDVGLRPRDPVGMNDPPKSPPSAPKEAETAAQAARAARLASALRQNLRRRKAAAPPPVPEEDA